ncbi:MAG: hypothetical protein GX220_06765 [Treponema sp.]|nr:hypothetical protein [Treponema sp.]
MRKLFICVLLILLFSIVCFSQKWKSPYNKPPVFPPAKTHPRLCFTNAKLEQIKQNFLHEENLFAYKEYQRLIKNKKIVFFEKKFDGKILGYIEAYAFNALVEKDKSFATLAYESLLKCFSTLNVEDIYDKYRPIGQLMFTASEVYDWCYYYLTKSQKQKIINEVLKIAEHMEIGCPPAKQGSFTGHGCESQLLKNYLAFSIAIFDERPDVWDFVAGRLFDDFVPARNFYYEAGLLNFQGSNYGPYRGSFDIWCSLLFERMDVKNPFEKNQNKSLDAFLYYERPDGQMWRIGDDVGERYATYSKNHYAYYSFYAAMIGQNPFLKNYAKKLLNNFNKFNYNKSGESDDTITPIQFLIFNDIELKCESIESMPLVRFNKSPMGEYFARNSWTNDATAVHMKIGEWNSANHEHRDSGTFEIFSGTILASDSGYYVAGGIGGGYKSDTTQKYLHGTIAHNCLLIEGETVTPEDYGGQTNVGEVKTIKEFLANEKYNFAKIISNAHHMKENEKGFVLLSGDLSNAYIHANFVQRTMLAFFTNEKEKPLSFFVFDKIDTKKNANPVFLLHTQVEPIVKNKQIEVDNKYGIKLCMTSLLPKQIDVKKIGGEGKQFDVAGINFPPQIEVKKDIVAEIGWGRVEIREVKNIIDKNNDSIFFNVFDVKREKFNNDLEISDDEWKLTERENIYIAENNKMCVIFCDSFEINNIEIVIEKSKKQNMKEVFIYGLRSGTWIVNDVKMNVAEKENYLWLNNYDLEVVKMLRIK